MEPAENVCRLFTELGLSDYLDDFLWIQQQCYNSTVTMTQSVDPTNGQLKFNRILLTSSRSLEARILDRQCVNLLLLPASRLVSLSVESQNTLREISERSHDLYSRISKIVDGLVQAS